MQKKPFALPFAHFMDGGGGRRPRKDCRQPLWLVGCVAGTTAYINGNYLTNKLVSGMGRRGGEFINVGQE